MGENGESKGVTSMIFILRNLLTLGTMCPGKEHCESSCVGEGKSGLESECAKFEMPIRH